MVKKSGWKSFFWKSGMLVVFVVMCSVSLGVYLVHEEMNQTDSPYCSVLCHEMSSAVQAMKESPHSFIKNCVLCHSNSIDEKTNQLFVHAKGFFPEAFAEIAQEKDIVVFKTDNAKRKPTIKLGVCVGCHVDDDMAKYVDIGAMKVGEIKAPLIGGQTGHLMHVLRNSKVGCIGCHFGGKVFHNPIPITTAEMQSRCEECHTSKKENYAKHKVSELSCLNCHDFKKRVFGNTSGGNNAPSMIPGRKTCASSKGCHGDPHVQKISKGSKSMLKFTGSQPCSTCHIVHKNEIIKNAVRFQRSIS